MNQQEYSKKEKKKELNRETIKKLKLYYSCLTSKYNMILSTKNREFAMLRPKHLSQFHNIRYIRAYSCQYLNDWIHEIMKFDRLEKRQGYSYNLYVSLAHYDNIPIRKITKQGLPYNKEWWKTDWKHITSYDLLIDIDAHVDKQYQFHNKFLEARKVTYKIHTALNKESIPHQVIFSGQGFHIVIPQKNVTDIREYDPSHKGNIYRVYSRYIRHLSDLYGDVIDTSVLGVKKLRKLPYSISVYKNNCYLTLPLVSSMQIEYFILDMANPYKWVDNKISPYPKGRGLYTFNEEGKGKLSKAIKRMKNDKNKKEV